MWTCACGCQGIAASLGFCPMCFKERDDMPKATTSGPSNADALPDEPGYIAPEDGAAEDVQAAPEAPAESLPVREPVRKRQSPAAASTAASVTPLDAA